MVKRAFFVAVLICSGAAMVAFALAQDDSSEPSTGGISNDVLEAAGFDPADIEQAIAEDRQPVNVVPEQIAPPTVQAECRQTLAGGSDSAACRAVLARAAGRLPAGEYSNEELHARLEAAGFGEGYDPNEGK